MTGAAHQILAYHQSKDSEIARYEIPASLPARADEVIE
jgi:hypothetical protein